MALNDFTLNEATLNGGTPAVIVIASGTLVNVVQTVGLTASGSVVTVVQDVLLNDSASGSLVTVEQVVEAVASGTLISVEQKIVDSAASNSHLDRCDWDMSLVINGNLIDRDMIHGRLEIKRTESQAALCTFTLIPDTGVQDLEFFPGKTVIVNIETSTGNHRAFTGVVDIVDVDFIGKKLTFRCTDRRKEKINALGSAVSLFGFHSPIIFPSAQDFYDELEQRVSTVPFAFDFDAHGNPTFTSWNAKATADYELGNSDIYYGSTQVEFAPRGRITNNVQINFDYRFPRLHHLQMNFNWQSPIATNISLLLVDGYSLTSREMVLAAIGATSWVLNGDVTFTDIWPSGWYTINGTPVGWSTSQLRGTAVQAQRISYDVTTDPITNTPKFIKTGTPIFESVASDDNGNLTPVMEVQNQSITDFSAVYCMGASWNATTRWAQTLTERYTISVTAPQSTSQYGVITEELDYGLEADFDTNLWENYRVYTNLGLGTDYNIDHAVNRADFNAASIVAMNKAKTAILKAHRDTRANASMFIWPEVDLRHTVFFNTTELQAKGKVFEITHFLNHDTTEAKTTVSLAISRAQGSTTEQTLAVPTPPTDTVELPVGNISLGNHFGEDIEKASDAAKWNGMIGNKWVTVNMGGGITDTFKTQFLEQFIVDTPPIPSELRDEKELPVTVSYNIEIPNDTLVVTF